MYTCEPTKTILLEFRSMSRPVEVEVPSHVMRYLDIYAERVNMPDGNVIYRQVKDKSPLPRLFTPRYRQAVVSA